MLETAKVEQDKSLVKLHAKADASTLVTAARMLLMPAVGASREAARRAQCVNNMKQIGLAMHNYHAANGRFPAPILYGPDGKTPHSWRVALLPFLEANDVYSQYRFDEPWDGPNNRKLITKMPACFACPNHDEARFGHFSSYYGLTGPDTLFPDRKEGVQLQEVTDGTSNTIMVVEARKEIPWTKPDDIPYDKDKALPATGGLHPGGFNAAFTDGAVKFLSQSIDKTVLRALITRAGGEVISINSN
jgi:prepilin-type processing-associated H-X9-DG protein